MQALLESVSVISSTEKMCICPSLWKGVKENYTRTWKVVILVFPQTVRKSYNIFVHIKWHINGVLVKLIILYSYIMITAKGLLIDASTVAFITSKKIHQISSLKATSSTVLLPPYCRMWDLSKKFDVTVEQGNDQMIMQSDLLAAVLLLQGCVQLSMIHQ